jgi:hypothetical protein
MISSKDSAPWHSCQRDKESFRACPVVKPCLDMLNITEVCSRVTAENESEGARRGSDRSSRFAGARA